MIKYHKIKNIFTRDEQGSKKLQEGYFANKTIESLKDIKWLWSEKVDGTNISIHWDGYNLCFHGRTEKAQIPTPLFDRLTQLFANEETEQIFEQLFGEKEVILFGEGYGGNIQKVGKDYLDDFDFILFDVYIPNGNIFLERSNVFDIAMKLGIKVVPIVGAGTLEEAVKYVKSKPISQIGKKQAIMEGVVCRPENELYDRLGERLIVKIKVRDFEEVQK